ncbi:MAG: glycosyltransferase family 4 protein [Candidatus Woesearchaeota archaeon]|nr:glycosyltransferase family 4 protein [Candidatus Woesearchaeota archaeon]
MKTITFIQPRNHNNVKDFIEELSNDFKIELITYDNNKFLKSTNIKYTKIQNITISKNKQIFIPNPFQLYSLIQKDKIITIKNLNSLESLFSLMICKIKKIEPMVFIQKINFPKTIIINKIYIKIYKSLLKNATLVSATRIGQKESKRFSKNPLFLPFGISINDKIKKQKHETINIICNSKIQKRKNVFELIKEFEKLSKEYEKIRLKIVAREIIDNDYYYEILNFIREKKLEKKVSIEIGISLEEVFEIYKKSDIYILVSYDDPAVYSHIEAMNYELPVILNKYNGTSDYIEDGKDGIIIKNKNFSEIYKALEKVITSDYKKMGKLAKNNLKINYDAKLIVKKFLEVIKK